MLTRPERMIAWRYLRARKREGFVSVVAGFSFIGILLGVATLIVVMSVMNGFRSELMTRILGINAHLTVTGMVGAPIADFDALVERLKTHASVTSAAPIVQGQLLASANEQHQGAVVRGMRLSDLKAKEAIAKHIVRGSLDDLEKIPDGLVIGRRLALTLGVDIGDRILLISPRATRTVVGLIPRTKEYPVVAMFDVGMFEYDNSGIFMLLPEAQRYFDHDVNQTVDSVEVMLTDPNLVEGAREELQAMLPPTLSVIDWQQLNAHFFQSLKVERTVMFLILALIIVVAAFNIISSLVMLVTDKTREIAILRTMGMTRGAILRIFITIGTTIGVVGTLVGAALGVAFASNIQEIREFLQSLTGTDLFSAQVYFLSKLPADVQTDDTVKVIAMALLLSFLATLYPAWKAAKTHPADGVRYE